LEYDPQVQHRRSIRLRRYDYSRPGLYFVTVCKHQKENLLGEVVEDEVKLNEAGRLVQIVWERMTKRFPTIELDRYVVMQTLFMPSSES
jgi:REP element-mobilizing transposase RayT